MSGRFVGFHPDRLATLSVRTAAAVEHLRAVASGDPAAAAAIGSVAGVRFELETRWLPAIARVTGDRSMHDWSGDDPPPTPFDQLVAATGASGTPRSGDPGDLVGVLVPPVPRTATGHEWDGLTASEQDWLITHRPDVVIAYALRFGIVLTPEQLDRLDEANRFVEFSESFLATFGLEAGVGWFSVELGGEAELIVMHLSDGRVQVMVAEQGTLGLGVEAGTIEIGAGIYARTGQVLLFDSEAEAADAIGRLVAAADQSTWEQVADAALPPLIGVVDLITPGPMTWLPPRSDVQRRVDELWDEHGVTETAEAGVYVSAHGELAGALALEGDASVHAGTYTTTDVDGNVTQRGVIVTGSFSGSAAAAGATTSAEASFVLDVHQDAAGDEYVTLTVTAGGSTGTSARLVEQFDAGASLGLASVVTASTIVTTTVTVPVDDATLGDVVEVVDAVRSGELPSGALGSLSDAADITIAVDEVVRDTTTVDVDAGAVEVEAGVTVAHGANIVTYHQPPGGQPYSQNEVAAAIDDARRAAGLPLDPAPVPTVTSTAGSGSW